MIPSPLYFFKISGMYEMAYFQYLMIGYFLGIIAFLAGFHTLNGGSLFQREPTTENEPIEIENLSSPDSENYYLTKLQLEKIKDHKNSEILEEPKEWLIASIALTVKLKTYGDWKKVLKQNITYFEQKITPAQKDWAEGRIKLVCGKMKSLFKKRS
jgi:hypothetical protein